MEQSKTNFFSAGSNMLSFSGDFKKECHDNIIIEKVNAKNVDINKTLFFKDILDEDISEGHKNILIDISKCDSIDSSFLGVLVKANKKLKMNNGQLKIIGHKIFTDQIHKFSGITKLFKIFKNKEAALQSYF